MGGERRGEEKRRGTEGGEGDGERQGRGGAEGEGEGRGRGRREDMWGRD